MLYGLIPVELIDPERENELIEFLRRLPIGPEKKKKLYWAWTEMTGVWIKSELVEILVGTKHHQGSIG